MDQKLMREFVEKKLKRGGYTNIAAANFPCGVWIKEDTKLYAVCLFDDPNKLAADPWRIDRVVDYTAQKVREQKQLECQFLALVLSYLPFMIPVVTIPFILPKAVMSAAVFARERIEG